MGHRRDAAHHLGSRAVDGHRLQVRRAFGHHGRARPGCRHAHPGLLRPLLHRRRTSTRYLRRRDGRLRGCHVRASDQRQHAASLRVLGTDDGPVVPARGSLRRTRHQPPRRDPGTAGHHRGWSGDVGRHDHPRPGRRQLQPVRTGREPADGVAPVRRDRPDPDRCALQIGNRAPALLASRCNGRANPCQRLSSRCCNGQGRYLPRRAPGSRVRRFAAVAHHHHQFGSAVDDPRRLASHARVRPQTRPRLRNRQPTRLHDGPGRHRHA